jgi:glycosyltransferase involved in cell wall biosynthesis
MVLGDCVLTNYPLSRAFEDHLKGFVGPAVLRLTMGELRRRPVLEMLRYLRSLKLRRLVLAVEDDNSSAILPVLKLLATIVRAESVYVIHGDSAPKVVSRLDAFGALSHLINASAAAKCAVLRAKMQVAKLRNERRIEIQVPKQRKILFLNANLWFGVKAGGSVGHISGVVNALAEEGCEITFASVGGRLMVGDHSRYVRLNAPKRFGFPWELNYYRFHFAVLSQLKELCARERFDVVYQRLSIANYAGVMLSRILRVPLVLEYNGSEAWIARNWGRPLREQSLAEGVEDVNLHHAHLLVTISDVLRDELVVRGVEPGRIVAHPNGIDPKLFDPTQIKPQAISELRHRYGIESDSIVVGFIGTFGQWHGAEILAAAIREFIDDRQAILDQRKVHFLLVGDGVRMAEVRSALQGHAMGPHVTLAGLVPQHEAPLYLAATDILVSPHVQNSDGSRFFGSPTKLFEYMAMGKAIIASDLDQIGEVLAGSLRADCLPYGAVEPNGSSPAVLCRPGDPKEILLALQFLIDRPGWRQLLGSNARQLALRKYTWKHHVSAILNGLDTIARKEPAQS